MAGPVPMLASSPTSSIFVTDHKLLSDGGGTLSLGRFESKHGRVALRLVKCLSCVFSGPGISRREQSSQSGSNRRFDSRTGRIALVTVTWMPFWLGRVRRTSNFLRICRARSVSQLDVGYCAWAHTGSHGGQSSRETLWQGREVMKKGRQEV